VLALYDQLSGEYADQAARMPAGKWRDRFLFALSTSLRVLGLYRKVLSALTPVMLTRTGEGVFAESTTFSRRRVQSVFLEAVAGAADAPAGQLGESIARLLYLAHLSVILWWLLDGSPQHRATKSLVALVGRVLPSTMLTLRIPSIRRFVQSADLLARDALLDAGASS
jgi:hypothetical protein